MPSAAQFFACITRAVLIFACIAPAGCDRTPTHADTLASLAAVGSTYSIQVISTDPQFPVDTVHGRIDGMAADQNAIRNYAPMFVEEFDLYPKEFIARTGLQRVILCSQLSYAGQLRTAIPDFQHNTLYLDVSRGAFNTDYLRKVLHHEYFHIIDYRDDFSLYTDPQWAALNPPHFTYGTGGINAQSMPDTSVLTTTYPGFLNHYSTTGVEEDKAELFANLIVSNAYVMERAKTDPVLNTKVQRMKSLLGSFCPAMNDTFWEHARTMQRTGR